MHRMVKYVVVTGGVVSGIGKGLTTSSIGCLLKLDGYKVNAIKIDPYINIDAGTFSPIEHGEVYVLDDGSEVDLDLGNYERFMNITLHGKNNITTGKIYQQVIMKERRGDYLGKTVQVIPHITDAIQDWIQDVSSNTKDDVCLIELGGVVGDIESAPFIEAIRQFKFKLGKENFFLVHVSMLPEINGELKTKPTQMSIQTLRGLGLSPDILVMRTKSPINDSVRDKLNLFCQVKKENIIEMLDCSCIYDIPLTLAKLNVNNIIKKSLNLNKSNGTNVDLGNFQLFENLCLTTRNSTEIINIGLVGKYVNFQDSYHSVIRALQHSCLYFNKILKISWIDSETLEIPYDKVCDHIILLNLNGIIIPGGFGSRGVEGMINAARYCRENKLPMLGVCLGMQIMVIEAVRNLLGFQDANSTEFNPSTKNPAILNMQDFNEKYYGASMRLGSYKSIFINKKSKLFEAYGDKTEIFERHRHRYEINSNYAEALSQYNLEFVAVDENKTRMEILEKTDEGFYVGTQFHPEFKSIPGAPSPTYRAFIEASFTKN